MSIGLKSVYDLVCPINMWSLSIQLKFVSFKTKLEQFIALSFLSFLKWRWLLSPPSWCGFLPFFLQVMLAIKLSIYFLTQAFIGSKSFVIRNDKIKIESDIYCSPTWKETKFSYEVKSLKPHILTFTERPTHAAVWSWACQ